MEWQHGRNDRPDRKLGIVEEEALTNRFKRETMPALRHLALSMILPAGMSGGECLVLGKASHGNNSSQKWIPNLYAKDPANWKIIPGGPRGTPSYNEKTGMFTFTARKLAPRTGYSLVRYNGSPPNIGLLARRTTGISGKLCLDGTWKEWTRKIWLFLSSDTSQTRGRTVFSAWYPEQYLFEEKMLGVFYACNGKHR